MTVELIDAGRFEDADRIPQVLERQRALQIVTEKEELGRRDGVACFNYLYTVITQCVQDDFRAGLFEDGDFITRLDVAFANRYLSAVEGSQASSPPPWRALLARRSDEWVSPLVFAVAGVSAHVNFDLAFALLETWMERGRIADTDFRDYQHLNDIFAREMQKLRDHLADREFRRLEQRFGLAPMENALGDVTVFVARYVAWVRGRGLWNHRYDPGANGRAERTLATAVGMLNAAVLDADGAIHHASEALIEPSLAKAMHALGLQP